MLELGGGGQSLSGEPTCGEVTRTPSMDQLWIRFWICVSMTAPERGAVQQSITKRRSAWLQWPKDSWSSSKRPSGLFCWLLLELSITSFFISLTEFRGPAHPHELAQSIDLLKHFC